MALHNYYVTFGVKYQHEKHPHWAGAHPDGWLEVIAEDYDTARDLVARYVGNVFAFMYEADRFERKWHPLGRLATLTQDGVLWPKEGVEPPTPLEEVAPKRTVRVSWYTTEHFTADIEVDEDFDLAGDDAEEILEDIICNGDFESSLSAAFTGTTDRQIIEKEES